MKKIVQIYVFGHIPHEGTRTHKYHVPAEKASECIELLTQIAEYCAPVWDQQHFTCQFYGRGKLADRLEIAIGPYCEDITRVFGWESCENDSDIGSLDSDSLDNDNQSTDSSSFDSQSEEPVLSNFKYVPGAILEPQPLEDPDQDYHLVGTYVFDVLQGF